MKSEDREQIKAAFQAHPSTSNVRILLATDAASEGVDLQNYCSKLIHYEIPWTKPSAASKLYSHFCVARYSVKINTRSSDHSPLGRI